MNQENFFLSQFNNNFNCQAPLSEKRTSMWVLSVDDEKNEKEMIEDDESDFDPLSNDLDVSIGSTDKSISFNKNQASPLSDQIHQRNRHQYSFTSNNDNMETDTNFLNNFGHTKSSYSNTENDDKKSTISNNFNSCPNQSVFQYGSLNSENLLLPYLPFPMQDKINVSGCVPQGYAIVERTEMDEIVSNNCASHHSIVYNKEKGCYQTVHHYESAYKPCYVELPKGIKSNDNTLSPIHREEKKRGIKRSYEDMEMDDDDDLILEPVVNEKKEYVGKKRKYEEFFADNDQEEIYNETDTKRHRPMM